MLNQRETPQQFPSLNALCKPISKTDTCPAQPPLHIWGNHNKTAIYAL